jgi:hypothetical protein
MEQNPVRQRLPITIAAARHVGEVLKCVGEELEIAPRHSFYM